MTAVCTVEATVTTGFGSTVDHCDKNGNSIGGELVRISFYECRTNVVEDVS